MRGAPRVSQAGIACLLQGACWRPDQVSLGHSRGQDIDPLAFSVEGDNTVRERKKGIVASALNVLSCFETRSALPDNDRAGAYKLSAVTLNTKPLGLTIATILC